jgi:hypothetical protein
MSPCQTVEVKAKENISARDLKRRKVDRVTVLPWEGFLDELWSGLTASGFERL